MATCRRCSNLRRRFFATCRGGSGSPEAGVAHRTYGVTQWFTGNFVEARTHLEHAAAIFDPKARSRSRLPLRPGRRRFRDGLFGDRPGGRSARLDRAARDRRRHGGANCEFKPSGDLDIWPDALRHVRDHRAQRRPRRCPWPRRCLASRTSIGSPCGSASEPS